MMRSPEAYSPAHYEVFEKNEKAVKLLHEALEGEEHEGLKEEDWDELWLPLLDAKITGRKKINNPDTEEEQYDTSVESEKYESLLGSFREIAENQVLSPEIIHALAGVVVIESERMKNEHTKEYMIASADPNTGAIHLFPDFFDEEKRKGFDPTHILAHELGHMAYRYTNQIEYLHARGMDPNFHGDYVKKFEGMDNYEIEEFSEMFANTVMSKNSLEMAYRRIMRTQDPEKLTKWQEEKGHQTVLDMISRTRNVRSFLLNSLDEIPRHFEAGTDEEIEWPSSFVTMSNNGGALNGLAEARKDNPLRWFMKFLGIEYSS